MSSYFASENLIHHLKILFILFGHLLTFFKLTFSKIISGTLSVSNTLDPDQAQFSVEPNLGPNCLKKISSR